MRINLSTSKKTGTLFLLISRSFGGELIKMHGEQDTEELIDKLKVSGGFAAVHNSIAQYVNSKEQDKERAIRKYFQ